MSEEIGFIVRILTMIACALAMGLNLRIIYKNHGDMLGAQFLRFWSLVILPGAILWGTIESIIYAVSVGPRLIVVMFACILAAIASALPKAYQQNFKKDK